MGVRHVYVRSRIRILISSLKGVGETFASSLEASSYYLNMRSHMNNYAKNVFCSRMGARYLLKKWVQQLLIYLDHNLLHE